MDEIALTFLEQGRQTPEAVAQELARFLARASRSIEIAIYDIYLPGETGEIVARALREARLRGVTIRAVFSGQPSESRASGRVAETRAARFFSEVGIEARPVVGIGTIMHDKYVVVDQSSPEAAVWTGSANWTTDSWQRGENVVVTIPSQGLSEHFHRDFASLWASGEVCGDRSRAGGHGDAGYRGEKVGCYVWFTPREAESLVHALEEQIRNAKERIYVATPVLTDTAIVGAFEWILKEQKDVAIGGIWDGSQMTSVLEDWQGKRYEGWKVLTLTALNNFLAAKPSAPYQRGAPQNFSHLKMLVVDDKVFTGSYNLSRSGESNAENVVRLTNRGLADASVRFIQRLMERYEQKGSPITRKAAAAAP